MFRGVRSYVRTSWTVFHEVPEVRRFLFANAAWEGTFAAMRTFVVLYITKGLGQPLSTSSAVLATVAVGYVIAALALVEARRPVRARAGDLRARRSSTAPGCSSPGSRQEWHNWYYGLILPVAVAGGTVMTLSWALLFKLMPAQHRGRDLRAGDDDEGDRAADRAARRRDHDRRDEAVPRRSTDGYEIALAGLRDAGARGDPARRLADPARGR